MSASEHKIELLRRLARHSEAQLAGALDALAARSHEHHDLVELQLQHQTLIAALRKAYPAPVSLAALQLALGDSRGPTTAEVVRVRVSQLRADHRPHVRALGESIVAVRGRGYRMRTHDAARRYGSTDAVSLEAFDEPTYETAS